jgi:hypothetical protein
MKVDRILGDSWTLRQGSVSELDRGAKTITLNPANTQDALNQLARAVGEPSPFPPAFAPRVSHHDMGLWFHKKGAPAYGNNEAMDAAFLRAAGLLIKPEFRCGRSVMHQDAELFMNPEASMALIVSRSPTGEVLGVDLPTALEGSLVLPETFYHLLDTGRVEVTQHRSEFKEGILYINPASDDPQALEAAQSAIHVAALNAPHDFTPGDFANSSLAHGTEKSLHLLSEENDLALMIQETENSETEATLNRATIELEIGCLRSLARLGFPVPHVERPVRILTAGGDSRWGYVQPYVGF